MENVASATPAIALARVESSQIHSIGHDPETNTLAIRFLAKRGGNEPGSLYHYANFTAEDFKAFSDAESIGSHFGKHIKVYDKKYPYKKIDESDSSSD